MQTSTTRLKKPLHIWLARILGFSIVFANLGANFAAIPEAWQKVQHEGVVQDVYYTVQPDGTFVVVYASSEAAQKGIAIGDRLLEADPLGEIGTPFMVRVQRENETVREVTFTRKPNYEVWRGMVFGLSREISTFVALLVLLMPIILGGIAALLIC